MNLFENMVTSIFSFSRYVLYRRLRIVQSVIFKCIWVNLTFCCDKKLKLAWMIRLKACSLKRGLNSLPHNPTLMPLRKNASKNNLGKGENAGYQHFLRFPKCFYPSKKEFQFLSRIYFVVCKCFLSIWTGLKFFSLVKSLCIWKKNWPLSDFAICTGWHGCQLLAVFKSLCLWKDILPADPVNCLTKMISWIVLLNGVLHHFQQYFSHIRGTVHIIHVYPGFQQY